MPLYDGRVSPFRLLIVSMACAASLAAQALSISVSVDPRVEVLCVLARLAGFPEFNAKSAESPYSASVDNHFEAHRDHAAVKALRAMRKEFGVSYDAIPSLAFHVRDASTWAERLPFEPSPQRLDTRWKLGPTRELLREVRSFCVDAKVAIWLDASRPVWSVAEERLSARVASSKSPTWMASYFGSPLPASCVVVPGLLCGPMNFGSGVRLADGTEEFRPVMGVWVFDDKGLPKFDGLGDDLFAHEICHSYANRLVDQFASELDPVGAAVFSLSEEAMRRQSYATPRIVLYETLVRACVIQFVNETSGSKVATALAQREVDLGFLWVPALARSLTAYASERKKYPALKDFMPRIVEALKAEVSEIVTRQRKQPRLSGCTPSNGSTDVDPATTSISFTFDRPMMDSTWSIGGTKDEVPEIVGKPSYDADMRVLTIEVRLKPSAKYRIGLNNGRNAGFKAHDGTPLPPTFVTFTTRSK